MLTKFTEREIQTSRVARAATPVRVRPVCVANARAQQRSLWAAHTLQPQTPQPLSRRPTLLDSHLILVVCVYFYSCATSFASHHQSTLQAGIAWTKTRHSDAQVVERFVARAAAATETLRAARVVVALLLIRQRVRKAQFQTKSSRFTVRVGRKHGWLATERKRTLQNVARRRAQLRKALLGADSAQTERGDAAERCALRLCVGQLINKAVSKAVFDGLSIVQSTKNGRLATHALAASIDGVALRRVKLIEQVLQLRFERFLAWIRLAIERAASRTKARVARWVGFECGALVLAQRRAEIGRRQRRQSGGRSVDLRLLGGERGRSRTRIALAARHRLSLDYESLWYKVQSTLIFGEEQVKKCAARATVDCRFLSKVST